MAGAAESVTTILSDLEMRYGVSISGASIVLPLYIKS